MADIHQDRDVLLNDLADDFARRYRRGERPALTEYISKYPELADDIRDVFPAMVEMEVVKEAAGGPGTEPEIKLPPQENFGDFQILREIGHGGMGVVYEAKQISLGRHVALKLLTQRMLRDGIQKRRFEREAKAAARLHHTNIVPVFGSGEHDGTPYYVMQFIQGLGLDVVVDEVVRLDGGQSVTVRRNDVSLVAQSLMTGNFRHSDEAERSCGSNLRPVVDSSEITVSMIQPGSSSKNSDRHHRKLTYWQGVARIGVQVADALEYAHRQGIIHRDVKPSNLLLDQSGTAWVTDFGLAKGDDQENLTRTGDMLGTLRYMPPEAFEGKSDARGDVYGLGITLYEMLALRPAFDEHDRNKLIKAVTLGEPPRLRRIRATVPRDLETIIHKAIDREPARRYRTAEELGADLQRFLNDEPIKAREISTRERAWRWCRRNPFDASLLAGLALAFMAGFVGVFWQWRVAATARDDATLRAKEAMQARDDSNQTRNAAARQAAGLILDRGIEEANNGAPGRALHLFVRALQTLPADDRESAAIERMIRQNITAWAETVPALEHILPNEPADRLFGFLNQLALSPDASKIGVVIAGNQYQTFNTGNGRPVGPPATFTGWLGRSVFAADSRSVWVESTNRPEAEADGWTVHHIDPTSGRSIPPTIKTTGSLYSMVATPDGRHLIGAVSGVHPDDTGPMPNATQNRTRRVATVMVWDTATGAVVRAQEINDGADFCHLGLRDNETITLWVPRPDNTVVGQSFSITGHEPAQLLGSFPMEYSGIQNCDSCLNFRPDMRTALISQGRLVHRWSDANPSVIGPGVPAPFPNLRIGGPPDGRSVVSVLNSRVFDAGAWPPRPTGITFAHPGLGDNLGQMFGTMEFSPEGEIAAAGVGVPSFDRRLWRMPCGHSRPGLPAAELARLPVRKGWWGYTVTVNPQVTHAVIYSDVRDLHIRDLHILDLQTGAVRRIAPHDDEIIRDVAWHPNGQYFATGVNEGWARVWDVATGRPVSPPLYHTNHVAALAFSPDGARLAAGDYGPTGRVKLWDWRLGRETQPSLDHDDIVSDVAFSPDGKFVSVVKNRDWTNNPELVFWELATGTTVARLPLHLDSGRRQSCRIVFRPDGQAVIARNNNGMLSLIEFPSGRSLGQRLLDGSGVSHFSPDGRVVAAAEHSGVRLLDGKTLMPLPGGFLPHATDVIQLAFSPDGQWLLTGRRDGSAQLWDVATRKPIGPPAVLIGGILAVSFTPDSQTCLCFAPDGTVRRWPVPAPISEPDLARLSDRVDLMTGQHMDDNQGLDYVATAEWQALRNRLVGDGSTALTAGRSGSTRSSWHDARAADAEQDGDAFGAEWHLKRLAQLQPTDWTVAARRGRMLAIAGRREKADAAYAVARRLAPSPQALADWFQVAARRSAAAEQTELAYWNLDRAIALTPDDWSPYAARALLGLQCRQTTRAITDANDMVSRGGNDAVLINRVAEAAAEAGDWKLAAALFQKAAPQSDFQLDHRYHWAIAQLKAGELSALPGIGTSVLERTPQIGPMLSRQDARRAAMIVALHADITHDWSKPLAWIDHALAELAKEPWASTALAGLSKQIRHNYLGIRGTLQYRAGLFSDAVTSIREAMSLHAVGGAFRDWAILAFAEHRLGHAAAAKEAAAKARLVKDKTKGSVWERAETDLFAAELDAVFKSE